MKRKISLIQYAFNHLVDACHHLSLIVVMIEFCSRSCFDPVMQDSRKLASSSMSSSLLALTRILGRFFVMSSKERSAADELFMVNLLRYLSKKEEQECVNMIAREK